MIGHGFDDTEVNHVISMLEKNGAFHELIGEKLGTVTGAGGTPLQVNETLFTTYPVLYDSVYVVGGTADNQEAFDMKVTDFVNMAYKFYKPIGVATTGQRYIPVLGNLAGVVSAENNANFADEFVAAVAKQRFWDRTFVEVAPLQPAGV